MAVLHLGRVVEEAPAGASPRHPHSRALLDSVPKLELRPPRPALRPDSAPHGVVPAGCAFHPRCALADMECLEREPDLLEVAEAPPGGHKVRCHHWRKLDGQ
jgi:oligopeptide/dipeptide ABC transporter ATP-binding protein